jgi:hypothetical protein
MEGERMGFLIYMAIKVTVKLCIWLVLVELWLLWALVALIASAIASAAGNERAAREWQRSMNWSRAFRL